MSISTSVDLACACRYWEGTAETSDDLSRGYRFVCPDCGEDVKLTSYSETSEINPEAWAALIPKRRT